MMLGPLSCERAAEQVGHDPMALRKSVLRSCGAKFVANLWIGLGLEEAHDRRGSAVDCREGKCRATVGVLVVQGHAVLEDLSHRHRFPEAVAISCMQQRGSP